MTRRFSPFVRIILPALLLCLATLCWAGDTPDEKARYLTEAEDLVKQFARELGSRLQEQMSSGGPESAITVCSEAAPAISSRLSREKGWSVKRISLKARNPLDIPDAWERGILEQFEKELASGKPASDLVHAEIVNERGARYFRYIKAIPAAELCLTCHGDRESLSPGIRERLDKEYPHDTATGYSKGMLRGAFSIKQPI